MMSTNLHIDDVNKLGMELSNLPGGAVVFCLSNEGHVINVFIPETQRQLFLDKINNIDTI